MLETSKDFFWIILSLVILWVGIFLGWGCYYLAMTLRDVRKITGGFRRKVDLVSQILETIKERTENTVSYLPPLVEGVTKLVEHFIEKKKNPKVKK